MLHDACPVPAAHEVEVHEDGNINILTTAITADTGRDAKFCTCLGKQIQHSFGSVVCGCMQKVRDSARKTIDTAVGNEAAPAQ